MKQLPFPDGRVEYEKCYKLTVEVAGYVSPITFTIGNYVTQPITIGTVTANGITELSFTASVDITYVLLEFTDTAAEILPSLNIDIDCANAACSECLELVEDLRCEGALVLQYYNDNNAFGLNYSTSSYQPTLIIKGGLGNAEFINNDEAIFNSSNGNKFLHYVNQREQKELLIELAPPYIHKAIARALEHHHFFIDGTEYVKAESNYTPDYKRTSFLAPCIVQVEEKLQNGFNRRC